MVQAFDPFTLLAFFIKYARHQQRSELATNIIRPQEGATIEIRTKIELCTLLISLACVYVWSVVAANKCWLCLFSHRIVRYNVFFHLSLFHFKNPSILEKSE